MSSQGSMLFGEGDGIFQRFNNSLFDTNGYRAIGGIGWDEPKSLFRGEIYGGYQAQFQENLNGAIIPPGLGIPPTDIAKPVFGGRLSYYPNSVLDAYCPGRPDIGGFDISIPWHSGWSSLAGDYRYTSDDLWHRAGLVGRRPGRIHSSSILWYLRSAEWLARRRVIQLPDLAEFVPHTRLPIHERALECGIREFYHQHGHRWCYLQILTRCS